MIHHYAIHPMIQMQYLGVFFSLALSAGHAKVNQF